MFFLLFVYPKHLQIGLTRTISLLFTFLVLYFFTLFANVAGDSVLRPNKHNDITVRLIDKATSSTKQPHAYSTYYVVKPADVSIISR